MTEETKQVAAEKKGPPPRKEKPDKCEQCSKPLVRAKWYYRENGYYCTKRCWGEFRKKKQEEAAKAAAAAAAAPAAPAQG